ncbi:hypothetical protein MKX01_036829 [Papaver californicum]|nr:hypothetical protein MKX01_036829 [Papaver californicum]
MDSSNVEEDYEKRVRVLMFPWLAHGHISPFLELAKRLASKNFYIYFCSTPINLSSIEHQLIDRERNQTRSIEVVELNFPSLPNLPPHYHTTKLLPHHLMPTLKKALDLSAPSFNNLLSTIQPDLLIYDFIQPWAPTQASHLNIPAIQLLTTGAAFTSFFSHLVKKNPDTKFPFPSIHLYDHEGRKVAEKSSFSDDSEDRERVFQCIDRSNDIVLINTFKEIEEKYLDYLSCTIGKELVAVGPLLQNPANSTSFDHEQEYKFRELLVNKESSSVVFVSFGTEYFMSKEELEEVAYGLELSEVNFIWVIRFPGDHKERDGLAQVLPKGFMERIGEKGLVVENWAPQVKILGSGKIGGFVSHCGWNSVLESMQYGVPIIAMPMHIDQPINARLVVELGLGVEVKRDRDGKLDRREIGEVIKKVVMGKEGMEVQRKAKEMSHTMRCMGDEDIDVLVEKLERLCNKFSCNHLV